MDEIPKSGNKKAMVSIMNQKNYKKVYQKNRKFWMRLIMNCLMETIEKLRDILCSLIENKELIDIEVVLCSHVLDKFFVKYMRENQVQMYS